MPDNHAQSQTRRPLIESLLHAHPGVRKASVIDDGCGGVVAFVVPDDSYMDEVLGRGRQPRLLSAGGERLSI